MQCPRCDSTHIRKNGKNRGKQNYICVVCGRQFIEVYAPPQGYSDEVKANSVDQKTRKNAATSAVRVELMYYSSRGKQEFSIINPYLLAQNED